MDKYVEKNGNSGSGKQEQGTGKEQLYHDESNSVPLKTIIIIIAL